MELLSPAHPPAGLNIDIFSGFSPPANFGRGFDRSGSTVTSRLPEILEEDEKVHVAVGKSVEKGVALIEWTLKTFGNHDICILHVHQPSSFIPTLLGKLPATQASDEVVSSFRNVELEETRRLLRHYLSICCRSKVKATFITIEADNIQKGIVDLVYKHTVRKLVIGATPDCVKVRSCSHKASYAVKNAPPFCELWFVNKGKLVWTRQASEGTSFTSSVSQSDPVALTSRSQSLRAYNSASLIPPKCLRSSSARYQCSSLVTNCARSDVSQTGVAFSSSLPSLTSRCNSEYFANVSGRTSFSSGSGSTSSAEQRLFWDSDARVEEEIILGQLAEVKIEAEASRNEASTEFLKCIRLEAEASEAISKVKANENATAHEVKLRKEYEDSLRTTMLEQEKLLEEKQDLTHKFHKAMRNIAVLETRAREANRRCEEVAGELKFVQASIIALQQEKHKIQKQTVESLRWLDHWKGHRQIGYENNNSCDDVMKLSKKLAEFSLSDLQSATCSFSESFRIGQGGYGIVYKGEMLDRTIAIKKLYPYSMQRQPEFQQKAQVLGQLQHPHLVPLIGICPESWSLVYEYLPGGNLQDRLFHSSTRPLNWKTRARIIAQIASGLLYLHSRKPEKIVHGNLKLENILLDSESNCKICDHGICSLVSDQIFGCPSFHRYTESTRAFPYADPEFHRTGILTHKSDIYSFGLIILQLLTGKTLVSLINEVRRALSCGELASILDSSAGEWSSYVSRRLVDLGLQFCELNSRDRPELTTTLVMELEHLDSLEERQVPSFFLCPILQEIMHDPQVASDGFTYEGEALRGWFQNGRETSPMTNLKLIHLHLTPNHALRLAIQDWLSKS